MYYCYNCKEYFDSPKWQKELMGEYCGQPAYDDFAVCPHCGDHDIAEGVTACDCCGEPALPREIYCEDCKQMAKALMEYAMKPFICNGAREYDALGALQEALEVIDRELTREATRDNERDRVSEKGR